MLNGEQLEEMWELLLEIREHQPKGDTACSRR